MAYTMDTSASQHNIYNYPEHLNPFYEDDQHKRLRFWKFGSSRSKSKNSERRGSNFSLDTLKEMWEFKTFRPKKKSSSLGIYKTSESPPPLRRESDYNSNYNTISSTPGSYRNTVSLGAYNEFERNVPYRSSLQSQSRANNELGFQRNNRYRSTVQNGYATYSGMATPPNPRTRMTLNQSMYSAPSQQSLNTNPFDDEDDSCSIISASGSISSPSKRPGRKKRRAPPPPVPKRLQFTNLDGEASNSSTSSIEVAHTSTTNSSAQGEELKILELSNLTAEIESFVKTTTEDQEMNGTTQKPMKRTEPIIEEPEIIMNHRTTEIESSVKTTTEGNNSNQQINGATPENSIDKIPLAVEPIVIVIEENSIPNTSTIHITSNTAEMPKIVEEKLQTNENSVQIEQYVTSNTSLTKEDHSKSEENETIKTNNITSNVENLNIQKQVIEMEVDVNVRESMSIERKEDEATTPLSTEVEFRLESMALPQVPTPAKRHRVRHAEETISLKIVEECENTSTANQLIEDENLNLNSKIVKTENYEFKVKYIPLKDEPQPEPTPSKIEKRPSITENGQKRSVKDIIDSINKSQSLLKVNQENAKNENTRIKELSQTEKELQRLLDEMNYTSKSGTERRNSKCHLAEDEVDNLFDKSAIRNKKSPTKEFKLEEDGSGLDWNPVPKPRRSKNFS